MGCPQKEDRFISKQEPASPIIDDAQGEKLLRHARLAIEHHLRYGKALGQKKKNPSIALRTGIFVTLWGKEAVQPGKPRSDNSKLRGCIGHLRSELPLFEFVEEVAVGAATRDPRFLSLTLEELDTIRIEIAILSPLREIYDLERIEIGQDGLILEGLGKRGLLLPKVAVRMAWDRESFLKGVCDKAGLSVDCWPGTCRLYAFTTVVFDEAVINPHKN